MEAHMRKALFGIISCAALNVFAQSTGPGQVGSPAAEWSNLKDARGKTYNLRDYRGNAVLFFFTVKYDCPLCLTKLPRLGEIAQKFANRPFQALVMDIQGLSQAQTTTFENELKKSATTVNFPVLAGIPARDILATTLGPKWVSYDALRDVFFTVGANGVIAYRGDWERLNAMGEQGFQEIESGISSAFAPTGFHPRPATGNPRSIGCICRRSGENLQINLTSRDARTGPVGLRILNLKGNVIHELRGGWSNGQSSLFWNGADSRGSKIVPGLYYVNVSGTAVTTPFRWTP